MLIAVIAVIGIMAGVGSIRSKAVLTDQLRKTGNETVKTAVLTVDENLEKMVAVMINAANVTERAWRKEEIREHKNMEDLMVDLAEDNTGFRTYISVSKVTASFPTGRDFNNLRSSTPAREAGISRPWEKKARLLSPSPTWTR